MYLLRCKRQVKLELSPQRWEANSGSLQLTTCRDARMSHRSFLTAAPLASIVSPAIATLAPCYSSSSHAPSHRELLSFSSIASCVLLRYRSFSSLSFPRRALSLLCPSSILYHEAPTRGTRRCVWSCSGVIPHAPSPAAGSKDTLLQCMAAEC